MANRSNEVVSWLLSSDPSVAWQAQRDLLGRAESTWSRTRCRVAREGWGARLLAYRADDGRWGGGLYQPKWTSTFYTMRLLTHLGISPAQRQARASCELLLDHGVTETGAVCLWNSGSVDTCVTAMLLHMACYFGFGEDARCSRMAQWLLGEQMRDGGWNCQRRGARHASFHTTISTLEGLTAYVVLRGHDAAVHDAAERGRDYFLRHRLYRSERTGEVVRPGFSKLSFPPRWYFDVLRGLEHFSAVDAPWDDRLADAVNVVLAARTRDGKWRAQNWHTGKSFFRLQGPREPSPMNTLRALRVLRWVDARGGSGRVGDFGGQRQVAPI
ncbi:MAG: hypothetical protein B7733_13540 [Myxococcales bacterium FL481]|nr:MAG: hypothetical protein B7733_13540 [Myxococcales bacterium FL481]